VGSMSTVEVVARPRGQRVVYFSGIFVCVYVLCCSAMITVGLLILLIIVLILITRSIVYTGVVVLFIWGALYLFQRYSFLK
jgi:hypothetical protein